MSRRRSRVFLWLTGAVLGALAGALALLAGRDWSRTDNSAAQAPEDVRSELGSDGAAGGDLQASTRGSSNARIAASREPSGAREADPASFQGRIEVYAGLGGGSMPFATPLRLLLKGGGREVTFPVRVEGGVWEGRLAPGSYAVAGLEGPGQTYDFECSSQLAPTCPRIRIDVQATEHWTLSAIDAETGVHLPAVTVVTVAPDEPNPLDVFALWQDGPPPWSEGGRVLVDAVPSPVPLPESNINGLYWATADGYAPRAFQRHGFHRHVRMALERSGTLEVGVASFSDTFTEALRPGFESAVELVVDPERPDHRPWIRPLFGGEEFVLDLAAGPHTVCARLVSQMQPAASVWSQTVEIPPGGRVRLDLELERRSLDAASAALTIFVVLPFADADLSEWSLTAWHRASPAARWVWGGEDAARNWVRLGDGVSLERTFDGLAPGEYLIELLPIRLQRTVSLSPGRNELILDGSAAADVLVSVSGAPADEEALVRWGFVGGVENTGLRSARVDASGRARFRCPPDPIWVQATSASAASAVVELSPEPGRAVSAHLDLEPARLATVRVSLWEQGSHAFVGSALWDAVSVESVGHQGELIHMLFGPHETSVEIVRNARRPDWSQAVLLLSPPGRYRLRIDDGAHGAVPALSLEFEAAAGSSELPVVLR